MKKILIYSLCTAAALAVTSCGNKAATSVTDQNDSISYAFGVMNGSGMAEAKATGMYPELNELDVDLYMKGLKEAVESSKEQNSYYMGMAQGAQLKQFFERMQADLDVNFDVDVFMAAFAKAVKGDSSLMISPDLARGVYTTLLQEAQERKEQAELDSIAATPEAKANLEAGMAFLAAKEKEEGVKKTESGLLYKVIKEGRGEKIKANERVELSYVGKLINDTIFDQNAKTRFMPSQGIAGWKEGLQLMSPGAKYEFYIPADLAYGVRGAGDKIPSNSTLIFEVEIFDRVK